MRSEKYKPGGPYAELKERVGTAFGESLIGFGLMASNGKQSLLKNFLANKYANVFDWHMRLRKREESHA